MITYIKTLVSCIKQANKQVQSDSEYKLIMGAINSGNIQSLTNALYDGTISFKHTPNGITSLSWESFGGSIKVVRDDFGYTASLFNKQIASYVGTGRRGSGNFDSLDAEDLEQTIANVIREKLDA